MTQIPPLIKSEALSIKSKPHQMPLMQAHKKYRQLATTIYRADAEEQAVSLDETSSRMRIFNRNRSRAMHTMLNTPINSRRMLL
jgi:hypothetical protein